MQRTGTSDQALSPVRAKPIHDAPTEGATISSMWRGTILDSIADGVFTVDDGWHITSFNRAAEQITGYSRDEVLGRTCYEIFRTSICSSGCSLRKSFETGAPVVNVSVEAERKNGARLPLSSSTAVLRSPDGHRVGGVETFRDLSGLDAVRRQHHRRDSASRIVGRHPNLQRILDVLPDVARSDATVLLQGPNGSGKGLLARRLHELSTRRKGPFVKVCCAALPEPLLESELFGSVRDAFTDARRDKAGRVAKAQGGTLFLDEIGDVPLSVQGKLLRLLQHREYEPVGSTGKVQADVRVVAATTRDLTSSIRSSAFREDLFRRLDVVRLTVPQLAERRDDIPRLVERFVERQRNRTRKPVRGVSEEAMAALLRYEYPGNVRELENAIEHAFVLCHQDLIEPRHLPASMTNSYASLDGLTLTGASNPRQAAEAEVIRQTLKRWDGNRKQAAAQLGMHRTTLWRKLRQYGMG